ncbi:MAG: hypothetical protein H0T46_05015 [Deltaproteobacteria bacterium]|nr:hypothetical protein [Deltaproteobacteria bacterium]
MKAVLAALLLAPTLAAAGPIVYSGPPGSAPPAPIAPLAQPVSPEVPKKTVGFDRMQERVASGRGLVTSTALTVPEGKVEASFQLVVPFLGIGGLNAGITKSTEVWVDGATTFESDGEGSEEHAYGIGIKQVIVRNKNVAIALTASLRKISENSESGWKSIGAVGSLCVDDDCSVMVSGAAQRLFSHRDEYYGDGSDAMMFTFGTSIGNRTTRVLIDLVSVDEESIAFFGMRFGGTSMAFDAGIVKPLMDSEGDVPTIPWLGLTARM